MRRAFLVLLIGTCAALGACQTRPPTAASTAVAAQGLRLAGDWADTPAACDGTNDFIRFGQDGSYASGLEDEGGAWSLSGSKLTVRTGGDTATADVRALGPDRIRLTRADGGVSDLHRCR